MLRLTEDAAGRILQELPPMPPRQLLSLVPPRLHAAAFRAHCTAGAAVLELTELGGLKRGARAATPADVLCAASRDAPVTAVASTGPVTDQESISTWQAVAALLSHQQLRSIAVHCARSLSAAHMAVLRPSIARLTQITQLSVSGCSTSRECSQAAQSLLVGVLPQLTHLQALHARRAGLDCRGAGRLAPVLARAAALTVLDLSGNPLGTNGWCALAHAGLPARLAALDARETFHTSTSKGGSVCELLCLPEDVDVPESLHLLKQALRACGQLQRLAVGPTSAHLVDASHSALVEWQTMSDRLVTVSDLSGAGCVSPPLALPALTRLQWGLNVRDVPAMPARLSSLTTLEALHLTYQASDGASYADPAVEGMFLAASALSRLTSLTLHFNIMQRSMSVAGGLETLLGHLQQCVVLRELDVQLCGSSDVVVQNGVELSCVQLLTALQTLSLRVDGEAKFASGFQLFCEQGLAFAPASLQHLTLQVYTHPDGYGSYDAPISCSQLTSLRLKTDDRSDEAPLTMPRMADTLAYSMSRLGALRELQLCDELSEPCVLAALAALPQLTALEVLRVWSELAGFPGCVVAALAGRTALRQLTIVHGNSAGWNWDAKDRAEILMALAQFSCLERLGLHNSQGVGAPLRTAAFCSLVHVLARLPRLALVVAHCESSEWEHAEAMVGRSVHLVRSRDAARDFIDGEWDI